MECFRVYFNEIEKRIDPYYYRPKYKVFENKLAKIGIIPFGQIIKKISNGFDYRDFVDKGIPYLRVSNIKPFEFALNDVKKIDPPFEIKKDIKLKKGDLLLTRKGTYGVALSLDKDYDYIISSEIFRIELVEGISPKLIEIILNSSIGQTQFNNYKVGGIMGSLSQDAIKCIKIPNLPTDVQNNIIALMDNAYNLKKSKEIEARRLLDSIDDYVLSEIGIKIPELRDTMYYTVNSSDIRGNRYDPYYYQPKFKQLERAIENGKYPPIKIKDLLEYYEKGTEVGSDAYVEEGIPFIRVADIDDNKIDYNGTEKKIKLELFNTLKEYQPQKGELLYSKDGSIGFCCIVQYDKESVISGGILRLKIKDNLNKFYIKTILSSGIFKTIANLGSIGSIIKHLTPEVFLDLKIPSPPLEIQNKIAEEIKKRVCEAEKLQKDATEKFEKAKELVETLILNPPIS